MSIKEIEQMILKEFSSYKIDKSSLDKFKKEGGAYERAGFLTDIIGKVVESANLLSKGIQVGKSSEPPFMYFTGQIYETIEYALFRRCVKLYLTSIGMIPQDWLKFANKIIAEAKEPVLLKKFKKHPKFIAFSNCVVDFETLQVFAFSPSIHIDTQLDYDFDMRSECPIWKTFLNQVLPDEGSRLILQQFFGLAFLDRYNNENKVEKALILVGEGSNGKSVIFQTMMNIFGTHAISNMDLNSLAKGGDEGQRNMAMLEGKRFNYCSEEQIGKVIQRSDIFKTLVSGEPLYARRIGENSFRIDNVPFLVFNMNRLPKFNDDSHGLRRRIMILSFDIIIPDELQDRRLAHKLKAERAGILKWLYDGYQMLKFKGFEFVDSQKAERSYQEFLNNQDTIRGWLTTRNIRNRPLYGYIDDEPSEAYASDLYLDYVSYCETSNKPSQTQNFFGRDLQEKGFEKRRDSKGNKYIFYGYDTTAVKDYEFFEQAKARMASEG